VNWEESALEGNLGSDKRRYEVREGSNAGKRREGGGEEPHH
jgi:hypothetical protein